MRLFYKQCGRTRKRGAAGFLSLFLLRPFNMQKEPQAPELLDDMERLFRG